MESTLKLIEDLQALPCLWDVKSQEYKNRDKRREAMESLAKKFSMSNHEMEKKLHNLKSQFRREYKKISASKKSGSSPKKCNWFGYQPLMFLLQGMEPRRSRSTDSDEGEESQTIIEMPVSTIEPNRKFEQVDSIPECDIEIKTEQDSGEEMKKEPEQCDEVETKFFINEEVIDIKPEEESRSCLDFSVKESEVKRDKTMWTKDLIKRFIELLKPRECLWRVSSVHYHNKKIRQTALNEIGSELKIHPEEVKQKFNRLRLQFAHEKNRMNSTKSESGSNMYVTRWEFFDSLKDIFEQSNVKTFAKRINTAILPERQEHERTENSHLGELENTTTSTEQSLSMASINRSENNIVNENENDNCIDEDETFPSAEPLASLPNSYSNSSSSPVPVWNSKLDTSSCYEKRNLSDSEELSVINRCLGVLENVQTKDECSIFGQYVASELRLILDEGLRFKLKRAIQMDILRVSNEYANKRFRSTEVVSSVSEEDGAVQEFRVL